MCRKAFSIFLTLLLLIGISATSLNYAEIDTVIGHGAADYALADEKKTPNESYKKMASTASLDLYAQPESGRFYVQDRTKGSVWYSNPINREDDEKATGVYRMEMASLLIVRGIDVVNKQQFKKNSETSSVRRDTFVFEPIHNGFRIIYTFAEEGFVIPVVVQLEGDSLKVAIEAKGVKETMPETNLIGSIDLLPYFGAAGKEADGYVFVPDGSGALMHLNNNKQTYAVFEQPIYGRDYSLDMATKPTNKQDVNLPVYGIKNNENAFLAVVTGCEEMGTICAVPNMKFTEYAQAYCTFNLRRTAQFILGEDTSFPQTTMIYRKGTLDLSENYELTLFILTGENANYSGMARQYRTFLGLEEEEAFRQENSLFIDLFGAVDGTTSILGIPFNTTEVLTEFQEARGIAETIFETTSADMFFRYLYWSKDNLAGKVDTRIVPVSRLGSLEKIKELEEYLSSVNGRLYLNFENQVYKKSGNGISAYFDNCKSLTKVPAYQYQYYFSTRLKNKDRSTAFLLKGNMLSKVTEKLLANVKKQEISNLSFTDLGRILYSDYGNPYMSRTQMKEIIEDSLKRFSTEHSLLLSDPKAYALPYADSVVDIPLGSSSFDVIDEAIPFLPMVLSGSLPYAGSALNLSENPQKLFLKSLESGSVLHYAFIAKDSEKLIDTELNWLYSADINTWLEDMALYQDAVKKLKYLTTGSRIQRHVHIVDRTYMTEYDNGIQVYVNYGEKDVVVSGVTVKSMGYVFVEGDSQ